MILKRIKNIVQEVAEKLKLQVMEVKVDKYNTITVEVSGGKNGSGKWDSYYSDLSKFVSELKRKGIRAWFIRGWNDCIDDVFYLTFGLGEEPNLQELGWKADREIRDAVRGSDVEEKVEDILDESAKEMGEAAEAQEKEFSKATQEILKNYKPWQQKIVKWARGNVAKKHMGHREFMNLYEHEFPKQFKEAKPRLLKENADSVDLRKSKLSGILRGAGIKKADAKKLLN